MNMKHTELRIGNLIQDFDCAPYHFEIEKIYKNDIGFYRCSYRNSSIDCVVADVQPIPLTEDWYDKIDWDGYKEMCINSYFKIDKQGHVYYHGDYTGINLVFVHSLQNFYFAIRQKELAFKK